MKDIIEKTFNTLFSFKYQEILFKSKNFKDFLNEFQKEVSNLNIKDISIPKILNIEKNELTIIQLLNYQFHEEINIDIKYFIQLYKKELEEQEIQKQKTILSYQSEYLKISKPNDFYQIRYIKNVIIYFNSNTIMFDSVLTDKIGFILFKKWFTFETAIYFFEKLGFIPYDEDQINCKWKVKSNQNTINYFFGYFLNKTLNIKQQSDNVTVSMDDSRCIFQQNDGKLQLIRFIPTTLGKLFQNFDLLLKFSVDYSKKVDKLMIDLIEMHVSSSIDSSIEVYNLNKKSNLTNLTYKQSSITLNDAFIKNKIEISKNNSRYLKQLDVFNIYDSKFQSQNDMIIYYMKYNIPLEIQHYQDNQEIINFILFNQSKNYQLNRFIKFYIEYNHIFLQNQIRDKNFINYFINQIMIGECPISNQIMENIMELRDNISVNLTSKMIIINTNFIIKEVDKFQRLKLLKSMKIILQESYYTTILLNNHNMKKIQIYIISILNKCHESIRDEFNENINVFINYIEFNIIDLVKLGPIGMRFLKSVIELLQDQDISNIFQKIIDNIYLFIQNVLTSELIMQIIENFKHQKSIIKQLESLLKLNFLEILSNKFTSDIFIQLQCKELFNEEINYLFYDYSENGILVFIDSILNENSFKKIKSLKKQYKHNLELKILQSNEYIYNQDNESSETYFYRINSLQE